MSRSDLLSLSIDDLVTLSNRGNVKRAAREVELAELTFEFSDRDDGTIELRWSDNVTCRFPVDKAIQDSLCSCPATSLCRHLVRSVLALQQQANAESESVDESPVPTAWDPGEISDEELAQHFRKQQLTKARNRFKRGVLVELVRSTRPIARFLDELHTMRFLVPGDLRYVHCDCAEPSPCSHVPLAIWAFRELERDQDAGVLAIQQATMAVPVDQLDELERIARELLDLGVANVPSVWKDRVARCADHCRAEGLIWPSEILHEFADQYEAYVTHDARFSPETMFDLVGELLIRSDAIRYDTGEVAQLLVRGCAGDSLTVTGAARFVGLGTGVRPRRDGVQLIAFLQDVNSGTVVGVTREFGDPSDDSNDEPKSFSQLARTVVYRSNSLASLAIGQLLVKSAKRSASHRLVLPRTQVSINPQSLQWENLRPPVLAESFRELRARFRVLPPRSLRPRRIAEDVHVVSIRDVSSVEFDTCQQCLVAQLTDSFGDNACLRFPYHWRGRDSFEATLSALRRTDWSLIFVSGSVRLVGQQVEITPFSLVFESDGQRTAVQSWVQEPDQTVVPSAASESAFAADDDPVSATMHQLRDATADLCVNGIRGARDLEAKQWTALLSLVQATGFVRLSDLVERVTRAIEHQRDGHRVDPAEDFTQLIVALKLSLELS